MRISWDSTIGQWRSPHQGGRSTDSSACTLVDAVPDSSIRASPSADASITAPTGHVLLQAGCAERPAPDPVRADRRGRGVGLSRAGRVLRDRRAVQRALPGARIYLPITRIVNEPG